LTCPNRAAAVDEAENSGHELLVDMLRDGAPLDGQAFEITNADGACSSGVSLKSLFWIGA
jgi:hypothetical protein